MSRQKAASWTRGLTLVFLISAGCATSQAKPSPETMESTPSVAPTASSTPQPPTPTSTPEPSGPTVTPTPRLASSLAQIVGTWRKSPGRTHIRISDDGTLEQARAVDGEPFAVNEVWFEGGLLFLETIRVSGVPSCGAKIGTYEVRMLDGDRIELVVVEDDCEPRRGDTDATYEAVR